MQFKRGRSGGGFDDGETFGFLLIRIKSGFRKSREEKKSILTPILFGHQEISTEYDNRKANSRPLPPSVTFWSPLLFYTSPPPSPRHTEYTGAKSPSGGLSWVERASERASHRENSNEIQTHQHTVKIHDWVKREGERLSDRASHWANSDSRKSRRRRNCSKMDFLRHTHCVTQDTTRWGSSEGRLYQVVKFQNVSQDNPQDPRWVTVPDDNDDDVDDDDDESPV